MYNSTESTPCQTTTSNSFGEFTFNNLLDDSYYIEIDSPGYLYYKTEPIQIKNGENIVLNSISLKFGDFNKDRQIDIMDLTSIENNYSASVDETNSVYDANDDSKINQLDRNELIQNYGNIPVVQNLEYTKYYSIELYVNSPTSIPILELKQEGVPLELLEEPENANSEFTFVGWSKTENSTVIDFELGDSYNEDNSIKLYAVWEDTTAPIAPTFQIVSGTVGSNGWYKSNVVVKINSGTDSGMITVTRAVGTSDIILTSGMVSQFSSAAETTNKALTVSYTENGVTKTTTYNINVVDSITGFTISTTPKTAYKYGEALNVTGGKITVTRGSGTAVIDITPAMVSGYSATTLGSQELTVTYGGFAKTYNVTVSDYVTDIILVAPSKTTYEYGQELNLSDATVKAVMASGTNVNAVPVTSGMISGYSKTTKGAQTVTVTYSGFEKQFGVTVEDNIQSIAMKTQPTKTVYKYGEQIDLANAKIEVTRSSGSKEEIAILNSMITGYSATTLGAQEITVTYSGKTTNFNVNVQDYVSAINITVPTKTAYKLNETLDVTGGKVTTVMASTAAGTTVNMTDDMITEFTTSTEGAKELTVTYKGFTKKFSITVSDAITGIAIQAPTKLEYKYGEELDLTGATVTVNKESGATLAPIAMTLDMVSGYNKNKLGNQTLTVTYSGKTNTFNVDVIDWDKELRITQMPKTTYEYNEDLNVENGKVAIYTASGVISSTMPETKAVEMTAGMVTGFSSTKEGTQTLTVKWGGFTTTYDINLFDSIKGISMNTNPDKTEYAYGEALDLTGATIKVVKTSGEYIVAVTDLMVSGYDANKSGEQVITVTYGGKTANFLVNVGEKLADITVVEPTTPSKKPTTPVTPGTPDTTKPVVKPDDTTKPNTNDNQTKPEEKPTATLGEQDKKEITKDEIILISIAGVSMLIALALLIGLKRNNAEIYVIVEGKVQYAGRGRINPESRYIDITKYISNYNEKSIIRLMVKEKTANKIADKEIKVKVENNVITTKIVRENNKFVINVQ